MRMSVYENRKKGKASFPESRRRGFLNEMRVSHFSMGAGCLEQNRTKEEINKIAIGNQRTEIEGHFEISFLLKRKRKARKERNYGCR